MELIEKLVSQMGVSTEQAEGAVGLIMKTAKEKLGDGDFSQLGEWIPGLDDLIGKAPDAAAAAGEAEGGGGLFGKVASAVGGLMGGDGGGLGALAGLAGGFSALGIDFSKISDILSTILDFIKEKGGDQAKAMLENVLK